jgi:hypothetical protein
LIEQFAILLLQTALTLAALYWINTWSDGPAFGPGPVLIAFLMAFIATGLILRIVSWLRGGPRRLSSGENTDNSGLGLPRTNRHPSDGTKLIGRSRIGKNVR